ncbi:MAG TPA: aspartate aminotransferase family protein, partial [Micromonosporaceae bacterium]
MSLDVAELQRDAREHLMLHFTDMSVYADRNVPIYTRGDGCHIYDVHGRRYIDGLSGLFCTNLGHGFGG